MIILNFSHPITDLQREQIESSTSRQINKIIQIPSQIDVNKPIPDQIEDMLNQAGLDSIEFQTQPILINLPSLNFSTAILLAKLHGRMGHFPSIIRLRPSESKGVHIYEFAELLNLQLIRDESRRR